MRHPRLFALLLLSGCASARSPSPPDAAVPPDAWEPCEPGFTDEGDACVAWRAIPDPPCEAAALARIDGEVVVRCADGVHHGLSPAYVWEPRGGRGDDIAPPRGPGPVTPLEGSLVIAERSDGSRVAAHSDVYAHPAAWRTREGGAWRETLAPPSAFVTHAAALASDEVLFVGSVAYLHLRTPR